MAGFKVSVQRFAHSRTRLEYMKDKGVGGRTVTVTSHDNGGDQGPP